MNADEILDKANPCKCGNRDNRPWHNILNGWHTLACTYCGDGVCALSADHALDKWNDDNPLPELNKDHAWQQATELAQSGSASNVPAALQATIEPTPNPINDTLNPFVKKTADELPDKLVEVLIYADGAWGSGWLGTDGDWYNYNDYWNPKEVQYWLPLPSFNPRSED